MSISMDFSTAEHEIITKNGEFSKKIVQSILKNLLVCHRENNVRSYQKTGKCQFYRCDEKNTTDPYFMLCSSHAAQLGDEIVKKQDFDKRMDTAVSYFLKPEFDLANFKHSLDSLIQHRNLTTSESKNDYNLRKRKRINYISMNGDSQSSGENNYDLETNIPPTQPSSPKKSKISEKFPVNIEIKPPIKKRYYRSVLLSTDTPAQDYEIYETSDSDPEWYLR